MDQNNIQSHYQPYPTANRKVYLGFIQTIMYKIHEWIFEPITKTRIPYIRKSVGFCIIFILSIIYGVLHCVLQTSLPKEVEDGEEEEGAYAIPELPALIFLTLSFVFATRNSIIWFVVGISFDQ